MVFNITYLAGRHDINPMFTVVSVPVMVLSCLFATIGAFEISRWFKFVVSNCISDGILGFSAFWVSKAMPFYCQAVFNCSFFSLSVLPVAFFASARKSTRSAIAFVKFRQWFRLFAVRAGFCYDCISHIRSFQRLWLEPVAGHTPVTGLFYYMPAERYVNDKSRNNIPSF